MNILITSSGRRSYLVKYFKDALGQNGQVFVLNSIDNAPSFFEADYYAVSPMCFDKSYIPFLLDFCKKHSINCIISVYDVDVGILAKNKELFERESIKVLVSSDDFVSICNDKWKTFEFLKNNHFDTPKTYLGIEEIKKALAQKDVCFPVVVKPRFGNGSIGVLVANNLDELIVFDKRVRNIIGKSWLSFESSNFNDCVIFQEFIDAEEYGIDVINDLNGLFKTAIIKKKIGMRSGETDAATVVEDHDIYEIAEKLGKTTKHICNLDCDGFLKNGKFYILEMNARFGGGYPFSHCAGVDLPKAIVLWLEGKNVDDKILSPQFNITSYKDIVVRKIVDGRKK